MASGFENMTPEEALRKLGRKSQPVSGMGVHPGDPKAVGSGQTGEILVTSGWKTERPVQSKYRAEPCIVSVDLTLFSRVDIYRAEHAKYHGGIPFDLPKSLKARAKRVGIIGEWFGSLKEGRRYVELMQLQKAGVIRGLQRQVSYYCTATPDTTVGSWVADFIYEEPFANDWRDVVEDCKGLRTALYKWKKKHVEAQYGITIRET